MGSKVSSFIDVNLQSSPGKPWINQGYRTKAEVMASPDFIDAFYDLRHPVWHVTTKTEFLPEEEVLDGKVRTYFQSPVDYVLQQKRLYDDQDARLKANVKNYQNNWSRYGFTKQYGGIDNLAHAHVDLGVEHEMGDVSGWDRLLPTLDDVYDFRERCLIHGPCDERYMKVVKDGLLYQYIVLPDGSIYEKNAGNPSGSGKTTTDNTIAHIQIRFHFWLRFFFKVTGFIPSYDSILANVIESIYGDDYFSSVTEYVAKLRAQHFTPAQYAQYVSDHYALYNGMIIKASAFKVSASIEDMEFLGSTFVYNPRVRQYCGEPRWSKLITTLTHVLEAKTPASTISTLVALYVNAATGTPDGDRFQQFVRCYCTFLVSRPEFQREPTVVYLSDIAHNVFNTDRLLHGFE